MVAALCDWHLHYSRAAGEIERRLRRGEEMVVAAPTLVEAYSVLTRFPSPHRLSPMEGLRLLEASFMEGRQILALSGDEYGELLRAAPAQGVAGGGIYDAVVAMCGLTARVDALLTFNERHFQAFAGQGMAIVVPG